MYNFGRFAVGDVLECSAALGRLGQGAQSMEQAAHSVADYFYQNFGDPRTGEKTCVLARVYKTHDFALLPLMLRGFARNLAAGQPLQPTTKCLTLLATVGAQPEWNTRLRSVNHQAIPLPSEQVVAQSPMIANLIHQMGLQVSDLLRPDPALMVSAQKKSYDVFYVPDAVGSPYIPAQEEFVRPYGVRSVLGFGGLLPSADLFAVILFSKVPIAPEAAHLFRSLALTVKGTLLPFVRGQVFAE